MEPNRAPATVRVDQWMWAIRLYKTRTAATDACRAGHVRVNGGSAKPAAKVRPGDRVEARVHGRDRAFVVLQVAGTRLPASEVAAHAADESPPVPPRDAAAFVRDRGAGRPTKRDRRLLDRLRP